MTRRLLRLVLLAVLGMTALTVVLILPFRWLNPPITMFMLADRLQAVRSDDPDYRFRHEWVEWDELSPSLKVAVIAAEDQRFSRHFGFDLVEIDKALRARRTGASSRGASTITQQTAKNLFLWSGQSWVRKGIEAWLTLWLELLWPKQRILEVYLNIAEFGPGVFGAEAASHYHFGLTARALGTANSALLAAVLPNPIVYQASAPSGYVVGRQRKIQRQMQLIGGTAYLDQLDGRGD